MAVNSSVYPGRISVLLFTSSNASSTAVIKGLPSRLSAKAFVPLGVIPLMKTASVRVLVLSVVWASAGTFWRRAGSSIASMASLQLRSTFCFILAHGTPLCWSDNAAAG